jgi:hypothetical protein
VLVDVEAGVPEGVQVNCSTVPPGDWMETDSTQ